MEPMKKLNDLPLDDGPAGGKEETGKAIRTRSTVMRHSPDSNPNLLLRERNLKSAQIKTRDLEEVKVQRVRPGIGGIKNFLKEGSDRLHDILLIDHILTAMVELHNEVAPPTSPGVEMEVGGIGDPILQPSDPGPMTSNSSLQRTKSQILELKASAKPGFQRGEGGDAPERP